MRTTRHRPWHFCPPASFFFHLGGSTIRSFSAFQLAPRCPQRTTHWCYGCSWTRSSGANDTLAQKDLWSPFGAVQLTCVHQKLQMQAYGIGRLMTRIAGHTGRYLVTAGKCRSLDKCDSGGHIQDSFGERPPWRLRTPEGLELPEYLYSKSCVCPKPGCRLAYR